MKLIKQTKIISILLLLTLSFSLVSCNSKETNGGLTFSEELKTKVENGVIKDTKDSIIGDYKNFWGKVTKEISFEKDEIVNFEFKVNNTHLTIATSLKLSIIGPDGKKYQDFENIKFNKDMIKSKNVKFVEEGKYIIELHGINHSDGFELTWAKNSK